MTLGKTTEKVGVSISGRLLVYEKGSLECGGETLEAGELARTAFHPLLICSVTAVPGPDVQHHWIAAVYQVSRWVSSRCFPSLKSNWSRFNFECSWHQESIGSGNPSCADTIENQISLLNYLASHQKTWKIEIPMIRSQSSPRATRHAEIYERRRWSSRSGRSPTA
ncbi:MAG: hypothetical protein JWQ87_122 [Candidatus Sulfotelmatobacter sp.]|nr:hypothetical protein [Candidatus Sulfotelmatobacter sp.]